MKNRLKPVASSTMPPELTTAVINAANEPRLTNSAAAGFYFNHVPSLAKRVRRAQAERRTIRAMKKSNWKPEMSGAWVTHARIGFGQFVYVLYVPNYGYPVGLVWGEGDGNSLLPASVERIVCSAVGAATRRSHANQSSHLRALGRNPHPERDNERRRSRVSEGERLQVAQTSASLLPHKAETAESDRAT